MIRAMSSTVATVAAPAASATRPMRVGAVSYLNTLPLIDGLEVLDGLDLRLSVPSLLIDALTGGEVDVALCSAIDYLRSSVPLSIVPVGVLGSEGPTHTVRLYSQQPYESLEAIHCDTDSHTSIALLEVLMRARIGRCPELVPYNARERTAGHRVIEEPAAMLLIGDKVVVDAPPESRYPYQLDLGAEWFERTGLPFVFATWMARRDDDPAHIAAIAAVLDRQRRMNRDRLDTIVHRRAAGRSWPDDLARHYLASCLRFQFDTRALRGLERFYAEAQAAGIVPQARAVDFIGSPAPVA